MNFSRFFVDRPIFASVLSVLLVVAGLIAMVNLPISEYPEVTPPSVVIAASYPGANATVISETVAAPLEEQINGVENMLYMSSQATMDGSLSITVTFKLGTDADLAQQLVQNRVSQALPRLPEEVRTLGVTVVKSSTDMLMVINLLSPNERYDTLYLRNYALLNIRDRLARVQGVGQVNIFGGGDYAMRIWLDPQKVAARNMTAGEVIRAIREQNVQVAAGTIGGPPNNQHIEVQLPINVQGRLQTPEEFESIILKTNSDGGITTLRDVARIEMGASSYGVESKLDNQPAIGIAIMQMAGSNAIEISDNIREIMAELAPTFPEGVKHEIIYDPTAFVRESIQAVIHTLLEAIVLVVLVVLIFLQTWRASIIPLLAVPVSILGTFAIMYMFGFSINALTLFGMVLAIGIVVDDAIVVVENVERNIHEGLPPREATYRAMEEVTGPIVAMALTLCAVFIPVSFISGLSGRFYSQFALAIAISTVISAFNSLTLSPAMAAVLLRAPDAPKDFLTRGMNGVFGGFFRVFNNFFDRSSHAYSFSIKRTLQRKTVMMIIYALLIGATMWFFQATPKGFIPAQDKQYLIAFAQLQDGATMARSESVIDRMGEIALQQPGVTHVIQFPGLSINGFTASSSAGIMFLPLDSFDKRAKDPAQSAGAIAGALMQKFAAIEEAYIGVFPPPPVRGLGTVGGFKLQIEDRGDRGYAALNEVVQNVIGKAYQNPALSSVFSGYKINVPQLYADVDRIKAKQLGLSVTDIYEAMQVYLGSVYVNDFNCFGRTYRVMAQADGQFRDIPERILQLKTRNSRDEMVPLGSVVRIQETFGPESAMRYNAYRSADINGDKGAGFSSGQAQAAITQILNETLPKGFVFEWTDLTYQEILAGNTMMYIFPLCVFLVFLVLAAQYESLVLPLAIILIVPMCLLCAIFGVWWWGGDNNIFTQIGLIVLVGLACKNAILIVEFARELEFQGLNIYQAAIEASRLRLRPILMTSFAFTMGVVPLVFSTGAGSEMRQAMGVAVFSGMIGVTFFGLFMTPVFYVLLRLLSGGKKLEGHHAAHAITIHPDEEDADDSTEYPSEKGHF